MLEIGRRHDRKHGAEDLLGRDAAARPVDDDDGRADVPAAVRHVVARVHDVALDARDVAVAAHAPPRVLVDERPDYGVERAWVPEWQQRRRADEPLEERVEHGREHDHARGGGAFLPRVRERARDDRRHGLVEVGVAVDDDGVLAAHLGHDALHLPLSCMVRGAALDDRETDRLRPGERHERDVRMIDKRGTDLLADSGKEGERARRHTGGVQHLDEPVPDAGRLLRGLEHDAVPGDERRRHHAGRDRERKVPRRDDDPDPARLITIRVRLAGRREHAGAATETKRLARVVLAEVDRLADVRVRLGLRLPRLEHLERRQLGAARAQDRRGADEDGRPLAPRNGRPGRRRCTRGRQRVLDVADAGATARADERRVRTRIDGADRRRRLHCSAVDDDGRVEAERRRRGRHGRGERRARRRAPQFGVRLVPKARRLRGGVHECGPGRDRRGVASFPVVVGRSVRVGRRDQRVESGALGEAVADERLVRRILEESTHEVGHPRHERADGRIDANTEAQTCERRVHGLRHPVEELQLDRGIGKTVRARGRDRVREAADVVAAECRPHRARMCDEIPRAALVIQVRLGFVLEYRHRPPLRPRRHGLDVPIGALHQAHV